MLLKLNIYERDGSSFDQVKTTTDYSAVDWINITFIEKIIITSALKISLTNFLTSSNPSSPKELYNIGQER